MNQRKQRSGSRSSQRLITKKLTGQELWKRVRLEGMTLADALYSLRPNSTASRRSATSMARGYISWFERTCPDFVRKAYAAREKQLDEQIKASLRNVDIETQVKLAARYRKRSEPFQRFWRLAHEDPETPPL